MTIVIHAGMPKAGSTSIQSWLQDNWRGLRERGTTVMVAPRQGSGRIAFVPYEGGKIESNWILESVARHPAESRQSAVDEFAEALADAAERHGDVVISGEVLAYPFWARHEPTLVALERLSSEHRVRVAYYVRPQHTSLEAGWRQLGWYQPMPPSTFVERRAISLHYARTRRNVHELAPGIDFEPRPLREDMLDDGDLIADFAGRFVGVEAERGAERANVGLPLELVAVLHASPHRMRWREAFLDEGMDRIRQLVDDHPMHGDERIALSRRVLQRYAHEQFAAENAALGWPDFVPPPDDPEEIPGIDALDELWRPQASQAEQALLFRALDAVV